MKKRRMIVVALCVLGLVGAALLARPVTAQTGPVKTYWYRFVQNNYLQTYSWVGSSNVEPNQMMSLLTSRNFIRLNDRRVEAGGRWAKTQPAPSNVFINALEISYFQAFEDDPLGTRVAEQ